MLASCSVTTRNLFPPVLQKQLEQHNTRNKHLEDQLMDAKQQITQQQVGALALLIIMIRGTCRVMLLAQLVQLPPHSRVCRRATRLGLILLTAKADSRWQGTCI
jgi:hypothetical protein